MTKKKLTRTSSWDVKRILISHRGCLKRVTFPWGTPQKWRHSLKERETQHALRASEYHSKSKMLILELQNCSLQLCFNEQREGPTDDRHTAERSDERRRCESIRSEVPQLPQTHQQDPAPPQTAGVVRLRPSLRLPHMRVFLHNKHQQHYNSLEEITSKH